MDPQRVRIWGRYRSFNWVASTHTWCACTRSPVIISTAVPLVPPPAPRCRQQYYMYIIHVVYHVHVVHKFKFICKKKITCTTYMYVLNLAEWCYGEEAAAIACKQRAMREKRACIMQGEKSSSVCPVIGHRLVSGAKLEQEVHATPRPEHTRSSIWWLEVNIFKCLVLDGL